MTSLVTNVDYTPFVDLDELDGVVRREVSPTDDGCSSLVYMRSGLPYGSTSETSLRVS